MLVFEEQILRRVVAWECLVCLSCLRCAIVMRFVGKLRRCENDYK